MPAEQPRPIDEDALGGQGRRIGKKFIDKKNKCSYNKNKDRIIKAFIIFILISYYKSLLTTTENKIYL